MTGRRFRQFQYHLDVAEVEVMLGNRDGIIQNFVEIDRFPGAARLTGIFKQVSNYFATSLGLAFNHFKILIDFRILIKIVHKACGLRDCKFHRAE